MRSFSALVAILGLVVLSSGCSDTGSVGPNGDVIVVQAFLYAGEPVRDIRLATTLPLDTDSADAPPVNDATVTLIKDDVRYTLAPSPGDSGYYQYDGNDLSVSVGDHFTIEVERGGQVVTAETTVPTAPEDVAISTETVKIPDFSNFGGFRDRMEDEEYTLSVTWTNDDGSLYYVVVENVDEDPQAVEGPEFRGPAPRFISRPTDRNEYRITGMQLTHTGQHRVRVYRVNQEYADLYLGREQDSRDLNEPLTNIQNGLGVFSAFNSDSAFFTAVLE